MWSVFKYLCFWCSHWKWNVFKTHRIQSYAFLLAFSKSSLFTAEQCERGLSLFTEAKSRYASNVNIGLVKVYLLSRKRRPMARSSKSITALSTEITYQFACCQFVWAFDVHCICSPSHLSRSRGKWWCYDKMKFWSRKRQMTGWLKKLSIRVWWTME